MKIIQIRVRLLMMKIRTFSQLKKLLNSSVPPKNVGLLLHLEIEMYENARLGS